LEKVARFFTDEAVVKVEVVTATNAIPKGVRRRTAYWDTNMQLQWMPVFSPLAEQRD
jgi:hypothetical protein